MKKISIFLIMILTIGCLCSCGGNDTRYDAIYDTKTKKYIEWGDTRETVIEAFGEGDRNAEMYDTPNYLIYVDYYHDNKDLNAPISDFHFECLSNGRYKILGISSEEEFLKKFPNADGDNGMYMMSIVIDKSNGKYYLLENENAELPNSGDLIYAYGITIYFKDNTMQYRLFNDMLSYEYKYYSSMDDHTIKDVQIVKQYKTEAAAKRNRFFVLNFEKNLTFAMAYVIIYAVAKVR